MFRFMFLFCSYCDCFAAGMFCNTTCACQGCSNNSENEETVTSTRQLIEARNPLAFAPRVVHANDDQKENAVCFLPFSCCYFFLCR